MKYIVLGLLLVLTVAARPTGATADPMTYEGIASFDQYDADGVGTLVTIHLQARDETTVLAISISRSGQSCGASAACGPKPLFAGSATQRIADGDATVDRRLAWASLHTRLGVFDAISNASAEITLDIQWTANGGFAPTPGGTGEVLSRDAAASGLITGPSLGAISLAATRYGTLSRHLGG